MQFNQDFITKMQNLLGDESPKFFNALESPSQKGITVNTGRLNGQDFVTLADFPTSPIPQVSNGYYTKNLKIGNHILSHLGIIYSQEPSAMYPVEMLDVQPGDVVLDLCSAPGGKSIQILEKLNGTGFLISNEIVYNRAKILYENLTKMGFKNFAITCNNPQDFSLLNMKFDRILVDAPCGGEGMFRKDNFDFNAYNNSSIETNSRRQINILNSIAGLLKPGGKLVYSTCTYDTRENEEVVKAFIDNHTNYQLTPCPRLDSVTVAGVDIDTHTNTTLCRRRYPHLFDGEGQFMALLTNIEPDTEEYFAKNIIPGYEPIYKKDVEIIRKAFKDIADISHLDILKRNDNYYVVPDITLNLKGLNVVSIGVLMGNIERGNLKIAHEFYHAYSNLFNNHIDLNLSQVDHYLRGEELEISSDTTGVCVVTTYEIALGGGKLTQGKLKNYYPKNLRLNK